MACNYMKLYKLLLSMNAKVHTLCVDKFKSIHTILTSLLIPCQCHSNATYSDQLSTIVTRTMRRSTKMSPKHRQHQLLSQWNYLMNKFHSATAVLHSEACFHSAYKRKKILLDLLFVQQFHHQQNHCQLKNRHSNFCTNTMPKKWN